MNDICKLTASNQKCSHRKFINVERFRVSLIMLWFANAETTWTLSRTEHQYSNHHTESFQELNSIVQKILIAWSFNCARQTEIESNPLKTQCDTGRKLEFIEVHSIYYPSTELVRTKVALSISIWWSEKLNAAACYGKMENLWLRINSQTLVAVSPWQLPTLLEKASHFNQLCGNRRTESYVGL